MAPPYSAPGDDSAQATAQRLEIVFHRASDAMMLYHLDEHDRPLPYIEVNDAAVRLYGYSREELLRMTPCDILPPEVNYRQVAGTLLTTGRLLRESTHITKDGRRITVEVSAHRFTLADRPAILTIGRDLSERNQAARALRDSEERYRTLFNSIDVGFCVIEMLFDAAGRPVDYRFVEVNPAFEKHCGLRNATGQRMRALVPENETHWYETYGKVAVTGESVRFVNQAEALGGRWFDLFAFRVGDPSLRRVAVLFTDITRQRQISQAMAEQARTLETIIRVNQSTAGELDLDKLVQRITDAGTQLTGAQFGAFFYNRVDRDGQSSSTQALSGVTRETFARLPMPRNADVFSPTFNGEAVIRSDDITRDPRYGDPTPDATPQDPLPVRSYLAAPVISRSGEGLGALYFGHAEAGMFTERAERLIAGIAAQAAVAIDNAHLYSAAQSEIAERKAAQEQLAALNATLEQRIAERTAVAEQRTRQLTVLAAELTHAEQHERRRLARTLHDGLQQLLVAAKLRLGLVGMRAADATIREPLQQVEDLIDQSVAMSRSLTVQLSPPILYDAGLAPALEWLGRWMLQTHRLTVDARIDPAAEPEAEAVRVLLFEAVRELLFNVAKHAGVDKATLEMSRLGDDYTRIMISDAGAGFNPICPTQGRADAQGIGLMSLRERLGFLGGRLEVSSEVGRGTRMILIAPLLRPSSIGPALPARGKSGDPADGNVRGAAIQRNRSIEIVADHDGRRRNVIRVLLADDHKILRQGLASLLEEEDDIEVIGEAEDGAMAVELALSIRPDVIVMDITMPRISGIEATRRITEALPNVRVVGLSMHSESDMAAALREAGAAAYVTKGGPSESLIAAIRGSK